MLKPPLTLLVMPFFFSEFRHLISNLTATSSVETFLVSPGKFHYFFFPFFPFAYASFRVLISFCFVYISVSSITFSAL